ncbi:MAG: hypothetical protein ACMXX7_01300 [Candidatus Woesearchaeota archaeon]
MNQLKTLLEDENKWQKQLVKSQIKAGNIKSSANNAASQEYTKIITENKKEAQKKRKQILEQAQKKINTMHYETQDQIQEIKEKSKKTKEIAKKILKQLLK